jgi:hypothetical protein
MCRQKSLTHRAPTLPRQTLLSTAFFIISAGIFMHGTKKGFLTGSDVAVSQRVHLISKFYQQFSTAQQQS